MSVTLGDSLTQRGSRVAAAAGARDAPKRAGVVAEDHPPGLGVRARDVELDGGDAGRARRASRRPRRTRPRSRRRRWRRSRCRARGAAGASSATNASTPTFWRPIAFNMPARCLDDALGRVADPRLRRQPLRHDAAELRQLHEREELEAVAERPRGGEHGVLESDRADRDREIRAHHATRAPRASPALRRRRARSATGPSGAPRVGTTQPKQTPKPQAIGASSERSHVTPADCAIAATAFSIGVGPQAYRWRLRASGSAEHAASGAVTSPARSERIRRRS